MHAKHELCTLGIHAVLETFNLVATEVIHFVTG